MTMIVPVAAACTGTSAAEEFRDFLGRRKSPCKTPHFKTGVVL